jgi:hypothetical protein
MRFFSILSVIAAFSDAFFFGLGSLPRIFFFLSIFNIIVYPNVTREIKRKYGGCASYAYVLICVSYAFKTSLLGCLKQQMIGSEHLNLFFSNYAKAIGDSQKLSVLKFNGRTS